MNPGLARRVGRVPLGVCLMENPRRHYAWGSRTAIPRLMGEKTPASEPVAELWMGAHAKASSRVRLKGGWQGLDELIRLRAEEILGAEVTRRFDRELPFLFKILAAGEPLSIQVHPDRRQAGAGFDVEERRGIALDAPERGFPDRNHKPEMLCALTPFEGLNGFRQPEEILAHFESVIDEGLLPELHLLRRKPGERALRDFFGALLRMPRDRRETVLLAMAGKAGPAAGGNRALWWMLRLADCYPGDMGALAPLCLNLVHLRPGEAVFMAPGELHAYLCGTGIEIMANSDNVLRAGLTGKPVDVEGLTAVARFVPRRPAILPSRVLNPMERVYVSPAEEFSLSVIRIQAGDVYRGGAGRSVEIILCLEGEAAIGPGDAGAVVRLKPGRSAMVPAAIPEYSIQGSAILYKAFVP